MNYKLFITFAANFERNEESYILVDGYVCDGFVLCYGLYKEV